MTVERLRDERGRALVDIETLPGLPRRADVVPSAGGPVDAIVDAVWGRLGGQRVNVIDRLDVADALVARGAEPGRHLFLMALDLRRPVRRQPIGDVTLRPMEADRSADYGAIVSRAYPPGHVDHEPSDADPATAGLAIAALLRGEHVGPWLPDASFDVRDDDGRIAGAIVVSEMPPGLAELGGPWISEIFVDPDRTGGGVGGALLGRSVAALAESGRPSVGLAVTAGNPAQRLYESFGFVVAREVRQVVLPAVSS